MNNHWMNLNYVVNNNLIANFVQPVVVNIHSKLDRELMLEIGEVLISKEIVVQVI